jgi:CheY-like chemotaxis protein/HPt (histidine-containing phosphotransfer) domain-containing protein
VPSQGAEVRAAGRSENDGVKGRVVLVVEDNPMSRTLAVEHLRVHGFSPLEARCASEALQKIRAGGIDALLLSTTLPDMDGCEVARLIRLHSSLPIIALSAYGAERCRQRFIQAGIDEVLEVPVDGMRLIQVLARWFSLADVQRGEESDGDGLAPVFDGDAFVKRSMNELSIVAHLVGIFIEEMPGRQQALDKALAERDMERVRELAHSLKGCAATISAERLRALAQRIERSAREDVVEKVVEYIRRLDKESRLFEEASRTFLASRSCGAIH